MGIEKGDIKAEIRAKYQEHLNDRLESNPEYQRRKAMTRQEKGKDAIDRLTKLTLQSAQKQGKEMSEHQARKLAEHFQNNFDRGKR